MNKKKLHINIDLLSMKNLFVSLVFAFPLSLLTQTKFAYPETKKQEVYDDYFGTKVADPYRWLEDDRSAETGDWVARQDVFTLDYIHKINQREGVHKRLTELWNYEKQSAPFKKGNLFFCFKNNGLQNQSVLYKKQNLNDEGDVLLDPNTLSVDGTISLNGFSISRDGKTLAYGISKSGSDWIEIHFRDIASKTDLPDVLKWVKFSGMSWRGNGIYYSRYDEPTGSQGSQKNQYHKVCYHQLGTTQQEDALLYGDKNNPDFNFNAYLSDDEKYLFISTSKSTSGEKLLVKDITNAKSPFITLSDNFDYDFSIIDNVGSTFYMLTNKQAPNYKLVSFSLDAPAESQWKTILPEQKYLLEGVRLCNHKLVANYLKDVRSRVYCYSLNGTLEKEIPLPGICKLNAFNGDQNDTFATYSIVSFIAPEQSYLLNTKTWKSGSLFSPRYAFKSSDYITEQVFYTSKDGTKIPMFITRRKDVKPNPQTPCFVYGYGGFNISLAPEFRIDRTLFLEAGGIYCVPNLRGGGEYGEDWHKAGTKCQKQNVFDDFIAACEFLVKNKYTSAAKLAIHGRSNGGLLIGAVMTQRPDICRVAVPTVGVLDMLRFHLFTIGRAWTVDYGCSNNQEEFGCLYKYSPLHRVSATAYPATLVLTGDHDDRVVPAHSFKFAATLQEKNTGPNPILIRIDVNAGHGAGKPTAKQIDEFADMYTFVFDQLGMKLPN